jgi:hypothetical protein
MSDDYIGRLRAMLDLEPDRFLSTEEGDLRTALDELERLRAERIAQAFASGWCDAIAAYRSPGWAEREEAWRKYLEAVRADTEAGA